MATKKKKNHFTLIELLIVVGIIAILASVIVAGTSPARAKARDSQRKADLAAYQNALQLYYNNHKAYPDPTGDPCCASQCLQSDLGNELSPLPQDPLDATCSGGIYGYYYTSEGGKNYKVYTKLERDIEAMKSDGGLDDAAYEVFSTMGSHLVISFPAVGTGGGGGSTLGFNCQIKSVNDCTTSGGVNLMRLSNAEGGTENAHAQLPSETTYDNCVCCTAQSVIGLGNDCTISSSSNNKPFLMLSDATNAHVNKVGVGDYSEKVCISAVPGVNIACNYRTTCQPGEVALCSISDDSNAHVGPVNTYDTKVCCKLGQ